MFCLSHVRISLIYTNIVSYFSSRLAKTRNLNQKHSQVWKSSATNYLQKSPRSGNIGNLVDTPSSPRSPNSRKSQSGKTQKFLNGGRFKRIYRDGKFFKSWSPARKYKSPPSNWPDVVQNCLKHENVHSYPRHQKALQRRIIQFLLKKCRSKSKFCELVYRVKEL